MNYFCSDFGTNQGIQGSITAAAWSTADAIGLTTSNARVFTQGFIHAARGDRFNRYEDNEEYSNGWNAGSTLTTTGPNQPHHNTGANTLPKEIKALRLSLNETQEQFAKRFARTIRAIRMWETGDTVPPKSAMEVLKGLKDD